MGHNFNYDAAIPSTFVCTPARVGTSLVITLTLTDTGYKLSTPKMIKAVLKKAISTYVAAESADLTTNGDSAIVSGLESEIRPGDGYALWTFDYANKLAKVTVTSVSNLNVATPFNVSAPNIYSH